MKKVLIAILLLGLLPHVSADYIHWVDFRLSAPVLRSALELDMASQGGEQPLDWIDILALAAAWRGGTGVTVADIEMKAIPIKVSRIAMQYYWDSLKEAKYIWTDVNNADGYQYEVKSANGKKTYFRATSTSSYTYVKPFPRGIFVKARVRAYVTVGNKVYYGAWSPYTYHASSKKVTAKRSSNGKKIYLKWKKVSGASGYQVYVSTKSNGGFKKVKSLSSKKSSYTITKCGKKKLKKGKRYYIQLRYQTKVGKKKVSSKIVSSATVY